MSKISRHTQLEPHYLLAVSASVVTYLSVLNELLANTLCVPCELQINIHQNVFLCLLAKVVGSCITTVIHV